MANQARTVSNREPKARGDGSSGRKIASVKSSKFSLENDISNLGRITSPKRLSRIGRAAIDQALHGENRTRFIKQFDESYAFFEGDQWINEDGTRSEAPSWRFRMNRNITFGMVQAIVSLMMDMRSTPYWAADNPEGGDEANRFLARHGLPPLPQTPGQKTDKDLAGDLTDMIHAEYDARNEHTRMEGIYTDMTVGGLGVEKTFWDRKRNRPGVVQIDPRDFLIDPKCSDRRLETAKYVVFRTRMDADDMRWRYGLSAQQVAKIVEKGGRHEDMNIADSGGLFRRVNYGEIFRDTQLESTDLKRVMVDVYHLWFHEDTIFGHEHGEASTRKFPDGRVITFAGEEVLHDVANPYARKSEETGEVGGHGMIPFALYRNYGNPRDPYGFGDIAPMKGNQQAVNVLWSFLMQGAALTGNPQWLYEEGALKTEWLTNKPGLAIEVPRGMIDRIQRLEPMRVSQDFYNLIGMLEDNVEQQTNINPALEGESPGSHASGRHIERLQDAAFKRMRQKLRNSDTGLHTRFKQEVGNVQQFHTLEEFLDQMADGEWLQFDDRIRRLKGDARIRSREDEATTPAEKFQRAIELMNVGAVDALGFVNKADLEIEDEFREALEQRRRLEVKNNRFQELQLDNAIAQLEGAQQAPQQQLPGGQPPALPPGQDQSGLLPPGSAGITPVQASPQGGPQGQPQFA